MLERVVAQSEASQGYIMKGEIRMSEARKCDRCHGFYDIAEEQQDRDTRYEFKGDYINLHLWVARNGIRKDVTSQWYDLCPKCMMELECWLKNNEFHTICELDIANTDCADRSNGATKKELELASKLNDAKIYIAQLKAELGYTMTKEEINGDNPKYKDPCKSCHNGKCEQCDYGYCSEEEKKKRWLGNHKKNVGDDDERVNNLYKEAEEISNNAGDTKEEEK